MIKQKIKKLRWEYLKTWVGIFQVRIFQVGVFLIPSRRYREDNTQKQNRNRAGSRNQCI